MSVTVKLPYQDSFCLEILEKHDCARGLGESLHARGEDILPNLASKLGWPLPDFSKLYYLTCNGYLVKPDQVIEDHSILILHCRILGGKGGFGSLLRSFGKKRVKTKNKNMCRDLSGRRVRDVQTEKHLKEWAKKVGSTSTSSVKVQKQTAKDNRIKRLKEQLEGTDKKHLLNDPEWTRERHRIPNFIHDAVRHGVKAASSKLVEIGVVKSAAEAVADLGGRADIDARDLYNRARNLPDHANLELKMPVSTSAVSKYVPVPNEGARPRTRGAVSSVLSEKRAEDDDVDMKKLSDWCGVGQLGLDAADDDDSDPSDVEEMVVTKRKII